MILLDALEFFRIRFAGRPLLLLMSLLVACVLFRRSRCWTAVPSTAWPSAASRILGAAALVASIAYVVVAILYASTDHYFDNAEPTMTAVGWLFHVGEPVYHSTESAERYAHIYGPLAFIAHGVVLGIFGSSIAVSKWLGTAAAFAALGVVFFALREETTALRSVVLTSLCALILLSFRNYSFWTRPEPLQLFCVSAALFFAVRANGMVAVVLVGLFAGIVWNLKLTGPLYTLPMFAVLSVRAPSWRPFIALGIAVVVAIVPFVVFSTVSWHNYILWVRLSGQTGLLLSMLKQNIEWAAYLALPVFLSWYAFLPDQRRGGREWQALSISLCAAVCGIAIAGSKPGAGPYHLIPILPVIFYAVAYQLREMPAAAVTGRAVPVASIAFIVVALCIAIAQQAQFLSTMRERAARREVEDIARFVDAHPGIVEMGYGSTEAMALVRPILVFRNNSYLIDQPAVREHQLAGVQVPQATMDALRTCRVTYWLIPKGEEPFSGRNAYDAVFPAPLYSQEFRRVFRQTHTLSTTTRYYDAWKCEPGSTQ